LIRGLQEGVADAAGQKTTNPAPETKPSHKNNTQKPASCGLFAFQKFEELTSQQGPQQGQAIMNS
ncbi:hypothetical protein, partial [Rhizobium leguminosarum]|uniref:hypothetical protein n=1 Tax=Rhizobium leguminosarum TaxID=384 RepID=UPI003F9E0264